MSRKSRLEAGAYATNFTRMCLASVFRERSTSMRKAPLALAAAATLGLATIAAPAPAEARWGHGGWGPGLAGGLLAGAIIGGIASSAYAYGPGYGYYGGSPHQYGGGCR